MHKFINSTTGAAGTRPVRWIYGQSAIHTVMHSYASYLSATTVVHHTCAHAEADEQTDGQTDRQTCRQTSKYIEQVM